MFFRIPLRRPLQILSLILALAFVQACATNPVTGKREFSVISENQEIQMGQSYDPQIVAEMGVYQDAEIERFLTEKGMAMARQSERPNLPWTFRLVDEPVVNAFAVPGGFVYFTRGIMAHFNNEAQFAGVLGHEIGHVTARHTVQQQSRQTLAQIGLVGGMILSPEVASQGEALMQGMQLLMLSYGRKAESQSDELGVKYSTNIGYDAREMAGFFSTLDRLSGGSENRLPTFLSTHPDPANREVDVRELARQAQAQTAQKQYTVNRDGYLRMIDGLLYGEDPKQGYTENGFFYHPELLFQFGIPQQWQLLNTPSMVQMVAPDQNAIMQMRLAQGSDQEAAARQFISETGIRVANTDNRAINGNPAITILGDITQQNQQGQSQSIRVIASFISYGGNVYMLAGLSTPQAFSNYQRNFEYTIGSFDRLTDRSKIDREAERIRIVTNNRQQSVQQALLGTGIPQQRLTELAILNGMELNEQIPAGMLFKSLSGGSIQ